MQLSWIELSQVRASATYDARSIPMSGAAAQHHYFHDRYGSGDHLYNMLTRPTRHFTFSSTRVHAGGGSWMWFVDVSFFGLCYNVPEGPPERYCTMKSWKPRHGHNPMTYAVNLMLHATYNPDSDDPDMGPRFVVSSVQVEVR